MTFISYAQNCEDVMLWRALKNTARGFYVDVGANDPMVDSVTQAFYERGWHGINIEPMQSYYASLCSARPRDINLPVAAGAAREELVFYEIPQTGLSTTNLEIAQKQGLSGWTIVEQKVMALPLNEIFEENVTGPIHFLKIDVEGAEDLVLKGLDFTRWRPWILVIEATIPLSSETNFENWEHMVLAAHYELVYFDGLNRFYIAKEHIELAGYFKTPPNFFDDYMTIRMKVTLDAHEGLKAERDMYKAELERVFNSRSYRITAPMRSVMGAFRVWRDQAKNKIKKIIKRAAIEISSRPRLKRRLLPILNLFPAYKQRIKNLVLVTETRDLTSDFLSADPASLSRKGQQIYSDLLKATRQPEAGQ